MINGRKFKTVLATSACALALGGSVATAEASPLQAGHAASGVRAFNAAPRDSSKGLYGPGGITLAYFCTQFSLWRTGVNFTGINNQGGSDNWTIDTIIDRTGDTEFEATDAQDQYATWFCG